MILSQFMSSISRINNNQFTEIINVFLFAASQSNMNGQGIVSEISGGIYDSYLGEKTNIKIFGALTGGNFQNYQAGVNARTTIAGTLAFGPECSFLQDVQAAIGKTIYAIKYAPGGVALKQVVGETDWNINSSGELYNLFFKNSTNNSYCKTALDILLAQNPNALIKINALVCANGERDAQLGSTTFSSDFTSIINQAKTDLSGYSQRVDVSSMKVVINRLKPSISGATDTNTGIIRSAQEGFNYANSDDLPFKSDFIHYTSNGTIVLGQRLATLYLSL